MGSGSVTSPVRFVLLLVTFFGTLPLQQRHVLREFDLVQLVTRYADYWKARNTTIMQNDNKQSHTYRKQIKIVALWSRDPGVRSQFSDRRVFAKVVKLWLYLGIKGRKSMPPRFYINNTKVLCVNVKTEGMLSCIGVNIGVKLLSKFIYLVSRLACMT